MKCIAIIPAYNEEKSIKDVIENIKKQDVCDIIVINDGSYDNTSEIAKDVGANVIDLTQNLGIGGAVQTGYKYAYENNYDFAFQIDGDGQHNPRYMKEMINYMLKNNADIIIGSRFLVNTGYSQTFFRKIGGDFISILIYLFTGKRIYDPLSGYRLVNKKMIEKFAKKYPKDYPEPETNLNAILNGDKIFEYSVEMKKRETGKSFVTPITAIWYMVKVSIALIIVRFNRGKI